MSEVMKKILVAALSAASLIVAGCASVTPAREIHLTRGEQDHVCFQVMDHATVSGPVYVNAEAEQMVRELLAAKGVSRTSPGAVRQAARAAIAHDCPQFMPSWLEGG